MNPIPYYHDNYFREAIVTRIVDGDTIECAIDLGYRMTTNQILRLLHIDAPERRQEGYEEAKNFLIEKLLGKKVVVMSKKFGKYRYLAEIFFPDVPLSINTQLLEAGLAKPYEGR
jgi:micrococcal nuclease